MDQLLRALSDLVRWMEEVTPAVPLAALPLLAATWFLARRAIRLRARPPMALDLLRAWAEMLALSCLLLLAAWAVSRLADPDGFDWRWALPQLLLDAALVPPAHALRSTLLRLVGRPGGDPGADPLRRVAWLVFAAVMMVCLHAVAMSLVFPFGGGEFHAMFAYTSQGRVDAAFAAWRASVLILGAAALVFAAWIPLPWWTAALLAAGAGMAHWWHVVVWRWSPQSPHFHRTVVILFVAMPFAILLIAAAGALLRRRVMRRRSAAGA
ncbi:MAG: hypothetical protein ACJ8J0_12655 [Longimicrobiaceae bacterium]